MSQQQLTECYIEFIDCLGYSDVVAEGLSILCVSALLYKSIKNFYELRKQRQDKIDHQINESLTRKIWMNYLIIIFLGFTIVSIIFSVIIFFVYVNQKDSFDGKRLQVWYKLTQILVINMLNIVTLSVGYMYWLAIKGFYQMIDLQQVPFLFKDRIKLIFYSVYFFNIAYILGYIIFILVDNQYIYGKNTCQIINFILLIGVILSAIICILSRIYFDYVIFGEIQVSQRAKKNQKMNSIILLLVLILRILITLLYYPTFQDQIRTFNEDCIDVGYVHAIILFIITIVVDLIPVYLFCKIFTTLSSQHRKYKTINSRLMGQGSQNNQNSNIDFL